MTLRVRGFVESGLKKHGVVNAREIGKTFQLRAPYVSKLVEGGRADFVRLPRVGGDRRGGSVYHLVDRSISPIVCAAFESKKKSFDPTTMRVLEKLANSRKGVAHINPHHRFARALARIGAVRVETYGMNEKPKRVSEDETRHKLLLKPVVFKRALKAVRRVLELQGWEAGK